jgi:hypothetical protein
MRTNENSFESIISFINLEFNNKIIKAHQHKIYKNYACT